MKKLLAALCALVLSGAISYAVNIPLMTGPVEVNQVQAMFNQLIQSINSAVTPATIQTYPNVVDNGAMAVYQRGTGIATCAAAAGLTAAAYSADRWGCSGNVTSGAGRAVIKTTGPTPPAGFQASLALYRNSGALLQPICSIQEVSSANSVPLQGQVATLSFYAQALAGLSADNGNVMSAVVITGTTADEGLGTMTASPAITPAWTGLATAVSQAFTITTGWVRYSVSLNIPATAKEIGVMFCFTPTATGAGVTDGFAFTGVQLEQGNAATNYQFKSYDLELRNAQGYYVQWADNLAATFTLPATCAETTSGTVAACTLVLPVTMRTTPTSLVATATSFGMTKAADGTAGACSTLAVIASSNTPNTVGLTCALSETAAVGTMHRMIYANSGVANTLTVSADF